MDFSNKVGLKLWGILYTSITLAIVSACLIIAGITYYGAERVVDNLADRLIQKLDNHTKKK